MSGIVTLGIDLAKNVFALHGVDGAGQPVLVRPNVARSALIEVVWPRFVGEQDFQAACREPVNAIWHAGRMAGIMARAKAHRKAEYTYATAPALPGLKQKR